MHEAFRSSRDNSADTGRALGAGLLAAALLSAANPAASQGLRSLDAVYRGDESVVPGGPSVRRSTVASIDATSPLSLVFGIGSAELLPQALQALQQLAEILSADRTRRIAVVAYARDATGGPSAARRLSLARAVEVRQQLMRLGVDARRMDVRALGDRAGVGPLDRVDVLIQ